MHYKLALCQPGADKPCSHENVNAAGAKRVSLKDITFTACVDCKMIFMFGPAVIIDTLVLLLPGLGDFPCQGK